MDDEHVRRTSVRERGHDRRRRRVLTGTEVVGAVCLAGVSGSAQAQLKSFERGSCTVFLCTVVSIRRSIPLSGDLSGSGGRKHTNSS